MAYQIQHALTIIRRKQVEARTGLPRSSLYALIQSGQFPTQIYLSDKSVGWIASEVDNWIAQRIESSRKVAA